MMIIVTMNMNVVVAMFLLRYHMEAGTLLKPTGNCFWDPCGARCQPGQSVGIKNKTPHLMFTVIYFDL